MASSSENIAKRSSASRGWICRRNNRFVMREGKRVNAESMVIQRLLRCCDLSPKREYLAWMRLSREVDGGKRSNQLLLSTGASIPEMFEKCEHFDNSFTNARAR